MNSTIFLFLLLSVICVTLPGFCLGGWDWQQYHVILVVHFAFLFALESVAVFAGVAFAHPLVGMMMVIFFWFGAFLFCGFLVAEEDTPWPFRACYSFMPIKFAHRSILYADWHAADWENAVVDANYTRGFYCPGDPTYMQCFGATGTQVLQSIKVFIFHADTKSTLVTDLATMLSLAAVFRMLHIVVLYAKCWGLQAVEPRVLPAEQQMKVLPADVEHE